MVKNLDMSSEGGYYFLNFEDYFEELSKYNDRSVIWNNWLDYTVNANLILKTKYSEHYYDNEEVYINMINAWINELNSKLESRKYFDLLGEFYEQLVQSRSKSKSLGQMYTPSCVTDLLSELVIDNQDGFCNDPTCGSGRTLLAAHVKSQGDLICIGQDLDETSCKMCVLNFFSHGVRGSVLHMDTLTGEFFRAWRVNKYLYHGLPVPHIEEIYTMSDAFDFIGVKHSESLMKNDGDLSLTKNDSSVQTKLI